MKEFFMVLFFSEMVLLTPSSVSFNGELILVPDPALHALTPGASLQIDVTSMIQIRQGENYSEFGERLEKAFPGGAIRAELITTAKEKQKLIYTGASLVTDNETLLSLHSPEGLSTNDEYTKVILYSNTTLTDARIYWRNYGK